MRLRVTVISPGGGGGGGGGGAGHTGVPPTYVGAPSFPRAGGGGGGGGAGSGSNPGMATGGGGGGADGAGVGLYQDFWCTLTQMRVLAKAALDTNSVAVTAANQRTFIAGSFVFASPVLQPVCQAATVTPRSRAAREFGAKRRARGG